ncbi:MAG: four helix bundle protein [Desulfobacterales bacterium]
MVPEGSRGQGFKDSSETLMNYKELNVWQKSYELCLNIYRITAKFPNEERYGLTSQIRRSFVSIPSNIAKGYGRKTTVDYIRMLYIFLWLCWLTGNPDITNRGFSLH